MKNKNKSQFVLIKTTFIFAIFAICTTCNFAQAAENKNYRSEVLREWNLHFDEMKQIISNGGNLYKPSGKNFMRDLPKIDPDLAKRGIGNADKASALDLSAFYHESDKTPFDIVFRRTKALLEYLKTIPKWKGNYTSYQTQLQEIKKNFDSLVDLKKSKELYLKVCEIRREIAFSNPILNFDKIIFSAETDARNIGRKMFADGKGMWIIHNPFKKNSHIKNIFKDMVIQNGKYKGKSLSAGSTTSFDLSFDGKKILFAWCPKILKLSREKDFNIWWDEDKIWHIFEANIDGSNCRQLTFGPFLDSEPCYLPSGRIAFVSTRRSPNKINMYIRCTTFYQSVWTLHSCAADGSDIVTMSYHDLEEFDPSVDFDGKLIYTRWEYYDKASHWTANLWKAYPDGRDPRAPHGNYYLPHQTFDKTLSNGKSSGLGNPMTERNIRAIPGSPGLYTATVTAIHLGENGSLIMINTMIPDDFGMGQVSRLTPEIIFPESEDGSMSVKHGKNIYGYCWPLSLDFYICSNNGNICYLDRFGNRELICDKSEVSIKLNLADPMPLRARVKPITIPVETYEGVRNSLPHKPATIKILNIYEALLKWPVDCVEKKKIKWLRILQIFPKYHDNSGKYYGIEMGAMGAISNVDYGNVNGCRFPLGVVPVEDDGSVYCYAPIRKGLYFQALDENGMAIQSMRSATNVQAGEQLSCVGCHEDKWQGAPQLKTYPKAFKRLPSILKTEVTTGAVPFNFHTLVSPVFEKTCMPCHTKQKKGPKLMNYISLKKYAFCFTAPRSLGGVEAEGSHTIPGHFGALASKMGKALLNPTHQKAKKEGVITDDAFRRVVLWLDCNSPQFGSVYSIEDVLSQKKGEIVFPKVDFEPWNPLGLEIYAKYTTIPPVVADVKIVADETLIKLTWKPITMKNDLLGCYKIYRNGNFYKWSMYPYYNDKDVIPGETLSYEISAINRNGLEGLKSSPISSSCVFNNKLPHIIKWNHADLRMKVTTSSILKKTKKDKGINPVYIVNGWGLSGSEKKRKANKGAILNISALNGKVESHDTNEKNMWTSDKGDIKEAWIQYDFGRLYNLKKMHIWNHNSQTNCGIKKAEILISDDGINWKSYAKDVVFEQADGTKAYKGFEYNFKDAISAKFLKINIKNNYGGNSVGLAEVQFYYGGKK